MARLTSTLSSLANNAGITDASAVAFDDMLGINSALQILRLEAESECVIARL